VKLYRSKCVDVKLRQTVFRVLFADKVGKREQRIKELDTDALIFNKLYYQRYAESLDSFYIKMLPIYKFTELHMEALEMMGKERHPFHDHMLKLIEEAEGLK